MIWNILTSMVLVAGGAAMAFVGVSILMMPETFYPRWAEVTGVVVMWGCYAWLVWEVEKRKV